MATKLSTVSFIERNKVHLVLILVNFIFSGWHILGSYAFSNGTSPLVFALYRELCATVLMACLAYVVDGFLVMKSEHILHFIALGVFVFGNVVGTVEALYYLPASNYAIMQPVVPVLATFISVLLKYETLSRTSLIGICLAVSGAIFVELYTSIVAGSDDDSTSSYSLTLGNSILACQVVSAALLMVTLKSVSPHYPSVTITLWYYSIGCIITGIVCLVSFIPKEKYEMQSDDKVNYAVIALVYASVLGTFFCYNAISWAVTKTSLSVVTIYNTLQPIGTIVLSFFILHDVITWAHIVGTIVVIIGLVLTVKGKKETRDSEDELVKSRERSVSSHKNGGHNNNELDRRPLLEDENFEDDVLTTKI